MICLAVVGATATGKSDLGVALARELDGEVVNADAMQLYRGMDVGTAKLTVEQRHGVPHHLLDVLDVQDEASLAGYQRAAHIAVTQITDRGHLPIVVGGSGLYVRAAVDRLDIPPTDPAVRDWWEQQAATLGPGRLHERLAALDPTAAGQILPGNLRRIVRALEVIELTGRPFSASLPRQEYLRGTVQLGLRAPRAVLDQRVADRVRRMWADGLLAEVAALDRQGLRAARTAGRAVGYPQALAQLDGLLDEPAAQAETVRLTRRLVRRQESWFGRDHRITWLDAHGPDPVGAVLGQALDAIRRHPGGRDAR